MKFIDLFAGIGGIKIGFENAGFQCVFSNDFDENAKITFDLNFSDVFKTENEMVLGDIQKIPTSKIPDFDILCGGFPCQPFSIAGYKQGFKDEEIFQAGLILKKKEGSGYIDRFRKRLMFPIGDLQGRIVAFTSRTLTGIAYDEEDFGGKYINSPQTVIYDKSKVLYGWHLARTAIRQKKYLIIVEGNMDAIAAFQAGTKNVVAVSGTALTSQHVKLIKRYTENVILAFDGDAAGSQAVFRSIALGWKEDLNLKILV